MGIAQEKQIFSNLVGSVKRDLMPHSDITLKLPPMFQSDVEENYSFQLW